MSARGPLEDALRSALADALKTDSDDVSLTVEANGWADLRGRDAEVRIKVDLDEDAPGPAAGDDTTGQDASSEEDPLAAPSRADTSDEVPAVSNEASDTDDADEDGDDADDDPDDADEDGDDGDEERDAAASDSRRSPDEDDDGPTPEELDEEADAAADFLEALLDAFDLPGDLRIRVSPDHAEIEVVEVDGGALIGRRGQTLDAIQELARCSLQRQFQRRTRVRIDVEGYRARRLEKLEEKTTEAIDEVLDTGKSVRLEPMDVFERKAVHGIVASREGVDSHSQGREPGRRVIIEPV